MNEQSGNSGHLKGDAGSGGNCRHILSTSDGARSFIAEYFAGELKRHDFAAYIKTRLAADFACALAVHLAARQPVGQRRFAAHPSGDGSICLAGDTRRMCLDDLLAELNAPRAPAAVPVDVSELINAFDDITGLCRHLRQGGPDADDLQGLSDGLEEAIDIAARMLARFSDPSGHPGHAAIHPQPAATKDGE